MPDSITNIEMDDVLSSIRRLVSEDGSKKKAPLEEKNDRFVLTPSHRIQDTPRLEQTGETNFPQTFLPDEPVEVSDLPDILTAASDAAVNSDSLETTQASASQPLSPKLEAMEKAWESELARLGSMDDDPQQSEATGHPESPAHNESLELRIAELEAAVGDADGEWEPDGSEPDASDLPKRHIFEVVDNSTLPDLEAPDDQTGNSEPVFAHVDTERPKPYLLSEVSQAPDPEPEEAQPIDAQAVPPEPAQTEDTPTNVAEFSSRRKSEIVDNDEVFLDVEALRTMITDVVREELRGKLGESITRNVRRMLQQEISQALSQHIPEKD